MARNASPKKVAQTLKPAAKEQIGKNPRRPPCCRICPDHPLRSKCTHTAKGRQYILEQTARAQFQVPDQTISLNPPPPPFSSDVLVQEQSPSRLTITIPRPVAVGATPMPPLSLGHATPQFTFLGPEEHALSQRFVATVPPIPIDPLIENDPGTSQLRSSPQASFFSPPQRPLSTVRTPETYRLNTVHTPFGTFNDQNSPLQTTHMSSSPPEMTTDNDIPISPSETALSRASPSTTCPVIHRSKKRATAGNPMFGHVAGVLRGASSPHEIHRTHEAPLPIEKSSAASKAFLEGMNSLFNKCEDISIKTGSWLFVGAQHANAQGGALHYASPRLRKDGRHATNEFASQFLLLMKQVSESRKTDVLELQARLHKSEQEMADMAKSKSTTETRLEAALNEIHMLKSNAQQIQAYRANLGIAP